MLTANLLYRNIYADFLNFVCFFVLWLNGNVLVLMVAERRARLVLGWVTIGGGLPASICNQPPRSTQPGHSSVGRCIEYG